MRISGFKAPTGFRPVAIGAAVGALLLFVASPAQGADVTAAAASALAVPAASATNAATPAASPSPSSTETETSPPQAATTPEPEAQPADTDQAASIPSSLRQQAEAVVGEARRGVKELVGEAAGEGPDAVGAAVEKVAASATDAAAPAEATRPKQMVDDAVKHAPTAKALSELRESSGQGSAPSAREQSMPSAPPASPGSAFESDGEAFGAPARPSENQLAEPLVSRHKGQGPNRPAGTISVEPAILELPNGLVGAPTVARVTAPAVGGAPPPAASDPRDRSPLGRWALSLGSSANAAAPGSAGSFFVPLAALLALLALAAPAILRRLRAAPDLRVPTPFVCALERPG